MSSYRFQFTAALSVTVRERLTICSRSLLPCLTAGDLHSAHDGSGGAAVALGDLHPDSRPACRTCCALLLAKGTAHLIVICLVFPIPDVRRGEKNTLNFFNLLFVP